MRRDRRRCVNFPGVPLILVNDETFETTTELLTLLALQLVQNECGIIPIMCRSMRMLMSTHFSRATARPSEKTAGPLGRLRQIDTTSPGGAQGGWLSLYLLTPEISFTGGSHQSLTNAHLFLAHWSLRVHGYLIGRMTFPKCVLWDLWSDWTGQVGRRTAHRVTQVVEVLGIASYAHAFNHWSFANHRIPTRTPQFAGHPYQTPTATLLVRFSVITVK